QVPDATLTIVAGPGPTGYRRWLLRFIRAHGLEGVVKLLPPCDRAALPAVYASYDVLFFYSMFAEPGALVLMEGFAAGSPAVASRAPAEALLVRDGETCLVYDPYDAASLVRATVRLLTEPQIGRRLAATAQRLVRDEFSLDKMGREYDQVLRQ